MKKFLISIMTVALLAVAINFAIAYGHGKGKSDMGFGFNWLNKITLTEDQQEKMDEMALEAKKEMIDLSAERQKLHLELQEMMAQHKPDENAVAKKVREIAEVETQMELNRINQRIEVQHQLTEEQWKDVEVMPYNCGFGQGDGSMMLQGQGHGKGKGNPSHCGKHQSGTGHGKGNKPEGCNH